MFLKVAIAATIFTVTLAYVLFLEGFMTASFDIFTWSTRGLIFGGIFAVLAAVATTCIVYVCWVANEPVRKHVSTILERN